MLNGRKINYASYLNYLFNIELKLILIDQQAPIIKTSQP